MQALQGDAESHGASIAYHTTVNSVSYDKKTKFIQLVASTMSADNTTSSFEMDCDYFVNATGMFAPNLMRSLSLQDTLEPTVPPKYAKGTYFKLRENTKPFQYVKSTAIV